MNQAELTKRSLARFGFILTDPKTGLTVSEEEQMSSTKKFNLFDIMSDPSNKTILIQQDQSPTYREDITRRTVQLVEAILNQTTTATVTIIPFKPNDTNPAEFLCNSIVLTVFPGNVNIDKARGCSITEGSSLVY